MKKKSIILLSLLIILLGFLLWRFIRPMNIFMVDERFAWPIDTTQVPPVLGSLSATECAACHREFFEEWQTTIHSQAWTDPYFQVDWQFDDSQHNCRLCHTPLDRQQPQQVLAYRDTDKWDPVLADNPGFDPQLQHEGVTCAACHYRDGKILGVLGTSGAPHAVQQLEDPNQVCVRCHLVEGDRWDTFFRFPPCGTVAEIESSLAFAPDRRQLAVDVQDMDGHTDNLPQTPMHTGNSGEIMVSDSRALGCVQCHMPMVTRPLVEGGVARSVRQHLWRGGHDADMVRQALTIEFIELPQSSQNQRRFRLTVTNTGAAHYVPTGTPDRHLTVHLRLRDEQDNVFDEQTHNIKRSVLWRPFIVDLKDTRLPRWQPRHYELTVAGDSKAVKVEAEVRFHLLAEARRKRIGYDNTTPINYPVFNQQIPLRAVSGSAP